MFAGVPIAIGTSQPHNLTTGQIIVISGMHAANL